LSGALISKVHPLRSHSVAAQGGMNASLGNVPGDTKHIVKCVKFKPYLS
jgi:succinate dehydrogenase/fumarate reductase flavoprotein subunit